MRRKRTRTEECAERRQGFVARYQSPVRHKNHSELALEGVLVLFDSRPNGQLLSNRDLLVHDETYSRVFYIFIVLEPSSPISVHGFGCRTSLASADIGLSPPARIILLLEVSRTASKMDLLLDSD